MEDGSERSSLGIWSRMTGTVTPGRQCVAVLKKRIFRVIESPTVKSVGGKRGQVDEGCVVPWLGSAGPHTVCLGRRVLWRHDGIRLVHRVSRHLRSVSPQGRSDFQEPEDVAAAAEAQWAGQEDPYLRQVEK